MSAHSLHQAAASPLRAIRAKPLKGRFRPPGDKSISHRAFLFGLLTRGETEVEGLLEGDDVLRTGKACEALGAVIERLAPGRWRIRGPGLGALLSATRNARLRQRRHRLATDDGRGRRPWSHRDVRRRRFFTQAPDAAHPRPASADGRSSSVRSRGRPLSDRAQGRARSCAHRVFDACRLGADQIGRPSRRPQRPGRDHRDRKGSLARPYGEDARSFRRRRQGRARGRGTADRTRRPAGIASQSGSSSLPTPRRRRSPSSLR